MREKLIVWAEEKFGEIHVGDEFNLKEETLADKQGRRIRQITMFLKKRKGIKQEWLKSDVFKQWIQEIKKIVGDNLTLRMFSTEGNEMRYIGGALKIPGKPETYEETETNYYNYQFNLVIWKKL